MGLCSALTEAVRAPSVPPCFPMGLGGCPPTVRERGPPPGYIMASVLGEPGEWGDGVSLTGEWAGGEDNTDKNVGEHLHRKLSPALSV